MMMKKYLSALIATSVLLTTVPAYATIYSDEQGNVGFDSIDECRAAIATGDCRLAEPSDDVGENLHGKFVPYYTEMSYTDRSTEFTLSHLATTDAGSTVYNLGATPVTKISLVPAVEAAQGHFVNWKIIAISGAVITAALIISSSE